MKIEEISRTVFVLTVDHEELRDVEFRKGVVYFFAGEDWHLFDARHVPGHLIFSFELPRGEVEVDMLERLREQFLWCQQEIRRRPAVAWINVCGLANIPEETVV